MSEFACRNGHLMSCRDRICPECGEPCYTMDGMTSRQLAAMERAESHFIPEEQEEQEEQEE